MNNQALAQAEKKWQQKDYPAAIKLLDNFLAKHPNDLTASNLRALVDHSLGMSDAAIERLIAGLKLAPTAWLLQYNLGVILNDLQRFDEAEQALIPLLETHPKPAAVLWQLEKTYVRQHNRGALIDVYLRLMALGEFKDSCRDNLQYCMEHSSPLSYQALLEPEIIRYLTDPDKDPEAIRRLTAIQLSAKYQEQSSAGQVALEDFASDPLFISALNTLQITDPGIEQLAIALRREILSSVIDSGELKDELVPAAVALAVQNHFNEYVQVIGDDEAVVIQQFVDNIAQWLDTEQPDITAITYTLLLVAMYRDPFDSSTTEKLQQLPPGCWPIPLAPLEQILTNKNERSRLATSTLKLTNIDNSISQKVQQQYEENPYPRWHRCCRWAFNTLAERLEAVLPSFTAPNELRNKSLSILIAGCGTGKQVVQYAKSCPEAEITAIDLSLHSLAYTRQKLDQHSLNNVSLAQADILSVDKIGRKFDVIVCIGVLHHMQDPVAAWNCLMAVLKPNGLMNIALYSRMARATVNQIRQVINDENLNSEIHTIRALRERVLSGELADLSDSSDFYSTSNCRDLLFHVHEISIRFANT